MWITQGGQNNLQSIIAIQNQILSRYLRRVKRLSLVKIKKNLTSSQYLKRFRQEIIKKVLKYLKKFEKLKQTKKI